MICTKIAGSYPGLAICCHRDFFDQRRSRCFYHTNENFHLLDFRAVLSVNGKNGFRRLASINDLGSVKSYRKTARLIKIFVANDGDAIVAIAISMDGKGAWRDNVFIERLWRSVKYEEVYLRAYETVGEARNSIGRYLDFYNRRRPHSSLDGSTPDQAYFTSLPIRLAA
jgi:transposase InsO family protein